jgi:hypothetical protein
MPCGYKEVSGKRPALFSTARTVQTRQELAEAQELLWTWWRQRRVSSAENPHYVSEIQCQLNFERRIFYEPSLLFFIVITENVFVFNFLKQVLF